MDNSQPSSSKHHASVEFEILESQKELIIRDPHEISSVCKWTPIFLYFLSAVTGYASSILFYILWMDVFSGNCPIWAKLVPYRQMKLVRNIDTPDLALQPISVHIDDWRRHLIVTFQHELRCKFYFGVCLCSCIFSIVWMMLFCRCSIRTHTTQWMVVLPALIFQTCFTIIVTFRVRDFEFGYMSFTRKLKTLSMVHMNQTELMQFPRDCQLINHYLEAYNDFSYSACLVQGAHQVVSWMMVISWFAGLTYLILRMIVAHDFLLRITQTYRVIHLKKPVQSLKSRPAMSARVQSSADNTAI